MTDLSSTLDSEEAVSSSSATLLLVKILLVAPWCCNTCDISCWSRLSIERRCCGCVGAGPKGVATSPLPKPILCTKYTNCQCVCAPCRSWGVFTRRVTTTKRGRNRTPQSTSPGCTQSRAPCPRWTRPSCKYRGQTRWRTWTRVRRTSSRTAARTAVRLRQDKMDLRQIPSHLRLFYSPFFCVHLKQQSSLLCLSRWAELRVYTDRPTTSCWRYQTCLQCLDCKCWDVIVWQFQHNHTLVSPTEPLLLYESCSYVKAHLMVLCGASPSFSASLRSDTMWCLSHSLSFSLPTLLLFMYLPIFFFF